MPPTRSRRDAVRLDQFWVNTIGTGDPSVCVAVVSRLRFSPPVRVRVHPHDTGHGAREQGNDLPLRVVMEAAADGDNPDARHRGLGQATRSCDSLAGLEFLRGALPPAALLVRFIDAHKGRFGVAPICCVLCEHGITIAPSTYYDAKARPPEKRASPGCRS
jgi:hypothetical protein